MRTIVANALFILMLFSCVNANAQTNTVRNITANINVKAEVIQPIELTTVNSMEFGNPQPGQKVISINPVSSANAGFMIAIGTPGADFRLTYAPEVRLTQLEGDATLTFVYQISGNEIESQATSEMFGSQNRNLSFSEAGRYYIWLGGTMNISNAAPGNYVGDFTIEIDYI